ncbi:hypothetical protein C8Q80DRAFT_1265364 [Daedaleopsis nitida]|nr:hypothetical protein C8Q80DRAFT_1265364 [Daedaleopsis nitida]
MRTVDSDSEGDSDYVPPNEDGSDAEGRAPKRARTHAQSPSVAVSATSEGTAGERTGENAYAAFKASLTASSSTAASASSQTPTAPETVKIVKRYREHPAKPLGKRPGPRKGKGKLADIPAKKEPIKRLTTLDKSAMDWRAHVEGESSASMKDELDSNRRGGGYFEKVEFLQRVESRKEEVLDASKGKRRR